MKTEDIRFIPLTDDLLFKEILASEKLRDFLVHFLMVFTELKEEIIRDNLRVEYEKILPKSRYQEKNLSGDVIVRFANYAVNIEMYSVFTKNSIAKSTIYSMRLFASDLKRGDDYKDLKSIMQLNFLYNVPFEFNEGMKSHYILKDKYNEGKSLLEDEYSVKYFRIDNALKLPYNGSEEQRILKFIGAQSEEERQKIAEESEILMEVKKVIDEYMTDEEFKYQFQLAKRQDEIDYYKEQSREEGISQGISQGITQGITQGIIQGVEQNKLETAKKMLEMKMSTSDISNITGLTEEEVNNLK